MRHHCKHCQDKFKIVKKVETTFGVPYTLECKHQTIVSKEIHLEKERQGKTLLSRFKNWVGVGEDEI
jgi:hypothetical protein